MSSGLRPAGSSCLAQAIGTLILFQTTAEYLRDQPGDPGSTAVLTKFGKQGFFGGLNVGATDLLRFLPALEARP